MDEALERRTRELAEELWRVEPGSWRHPLLALGRRQLGGLDERRPAFGVVSLRRRGAGVPRTARARRASEGIPARGRGRANPAFAATASRQARASSPSRSVRARDRA